MTRTRTVSTLGVLALYWALIVVGMGLCIAMRGADAAVLGPIWTGTVAGTLLGHALALARFRTRIVIGLAIAIAMFAEPWLGAAYGNHAWHAFLPATICAFWSLGDRTALAAFWFPAVLWMLPIVDRAGADAIPDSSGLVMLGVLAVAFIAFLRARETRRVALWREVAPAPIAPATSPIVLRDARGSRLARTGWTLGATSLAFAATAWLAPRLWQSEATPAAPKQSEPHGVASGLKCCPKAPTVQPHERVKDYFHLGDGHAVADAMRPGIDCRRCAAPGLPGELVAASGTGYAAATYGTDYAPAPVEPALDLPQSYLSPPIAEPAYGAPVPAPVALAPSAPVAVPSVGTPVPAPITPVAPIMPVAPVVPAPPPASAPPIVAASPPPLAPPAPTAIASSPPDEAVAASPPPPGGNLLRWAEVLLGGLLASQLVLLVLRPVRRLVTLRHLRRPFWDETVAQRVSNAWQLVLVGLRDAGYRTGSHESPSELARRVSVTEVERCATILERARHGVGLDAGDLETMTSAADSAYTAARSELGTTARTVSWLRWPLL